MYEISLFEFQNEKFRLFELRVFLETRPNFMDMQHRQSRIQKRRHRLQPASSRDREKINKLDINGQT
jgi:hypothetical protein